ncbi:type III-A CRISPR-associated RAMP protein Csm5 [Sulfurihydrogenibium sp.]|uniref:type III-A CRISPR-associated RAMP protein Csm5 n=1 Tax=Sulfurihydrogenibium sp. TaxID=2053621 RepID=UPI002625B414|nr:type III-A CRISPR-associated RAMP protein Csm5 [Sulfurihydrogenibium sp.]
MNLTIEILSPVHIGDGTKIDNWNYVYDESNKVVKVYSFDKVVSALKHEKLKLSTLLSKIERESLQNDLRDFIPKDLNPLYTLKLEGKIRKPNKEGNSEFKSIWSFIKVANSVYIPGSEIKGAIRTAIFYHYLKNNQKLKNDFLNDLRNVNLNGNVKKQVEQISKDYEKRVFSKGKEDGKFDFMKFVSISDTNCKNPGDSLYITDVKVINTSKTFSELHEVLKKGQKFSFKIDILWNELYNQHTSMDIKDLNSLKNICNEFAFDLIQHEKEFYKNLEEKLNFDYDKLQNIKDGFLLRIGKHQGFLSLTVNLIVKQSDPILFGSIFEKIVEDYRNSRIKKGYKNKPAKSRKLTVNNEPLGWVKVSW